MTRGMQREQDTNGRKKAPARMDYATASPTAPKPPKRHKKSGGMGPLAALVVIAALALIGLWRWSELSSLPVNAQPAATPAATVAPTPAPTATPTPAPSPSPAPAVHSENEQPGTVFTAQARAELDEFLSAQPGSVSVWAQDIETGETYHFNSGAGFYCASTLKAPYALWLCQRDEAGEIDLDAAVGSASGWQRLHAMIAQSSNGAAHDLGAAFPATAETGFTEFLRVLGFASPDGCDVIEDGIHGWVKAADGGRAMRAVYDYIQQGTENGQKLKDALLAADHELLWCPAPAAKKYGSWDGALHDMAIVYAERPYIVSVFTGWGSAEVDFPPEGVELMQQLGHMLARMMGAEE